MPVERLDAVDVDEMRRLRQPERHGRNQALAAGEHAAVVRRNLGQNRNRLIDRLRRVIAETPLASSAGFDIWDLLFGLNTVFGM